MQGMRIPLGSIWRISKVAKNTLLIHSKDFRPNVRFRFASKNLARHWHDVRRRTHSPLRLSLRTGSNHLCLFSSTSSSSFSFSFSFSFFQILHQNAFPGKALKTFALDFKWEVGAP